MKWVIHNGETEDYLVRFSTKDGSPIWTSDEKKKDGPKWFYKWSDVEKAIAICQKFGYTDSYPTMQYGRR